MLYADVKTIMSQMCMEQTGGGPECRHQRQKERFAGEWGSGGYFLESQK